MEEKNEKLILKNILIKIKLQNEVLKKIIEQFKELKIKNSNNEKK